MSRSIPHICFDRVIPDEYQPARATTYATLKAAFQTDGVPNVARMAIVVLKKWQNGSTLRCRFLDGTATQRRRVEAKAHLWEQFANIKFKFVASGDAEIRISFEADPGSWSALGNDALVENFFPKFQPTMNYGWLKDDTDDTEYNRVVLHEFGHALGAIHEHSSPKANLKWNKPEVYRVFSGPPNFWSKADIDHNVFRRYSKTQANSSAFDINSIMLYSFPPSLFLDRSGTPNNTDLSPADKKFIAEMYPFPKPPKKGVAKPSVPAGTTKRRRKARRKRAAAR